MREVAVFLVRISLVAGICWVFWRTQLVTLSSAANLSVIVGGVLLTYPLVWVARKILDRNRTPGGAVWTTTFVHCGVVFTFGVPIVRALVTHRDWEGWVLPVPEGFGYALVIITGAACAAAVATLALRGLGAPAIALSERLAVDWLYAWTRNPMVLAALSFFVSLGIWFRSAAFVLWVLVLIAPALLFFVKVFEERELEIRFGPSYLEYRARTPMLIPRRPRT